MSDGGGARLWPWALGVLGVLLAAGVVFLAVERWGPPDPEDPPVERLGQQDRGPLAPPRDPDTLAGPPEPVTGAAAEELVGRVEEMRAAVRRYEVECSDQLEPAAGEGVGALVAECIRRLSDALDAVVASDTVGDVAIDARLDQYREQLRRLRATPPGEGRAEPTRETLRSAAEVLAVIRDERYPETLEEDTTVATLRSAARALDPARPLSRQQERVQRFFLAAGGLLSAMARPGDPGPPPPPGSSP